MRGGGFVLMLCCDYGCGDRRSTLVFDGSAAEFRFRMDRSIMKHEMPEVFSANDVVRRVVSRKSGPTLGLSTLFEQNRSRNAVAAARDWPRSPAFEW